MTSSIESVASTITIDMEGGEGESLPPIQDTDVAVISGSGSGSGSGLTSSQGNQPDATGTAIGEHEREHDRDAIEDKTLQCKTALA